MLVSERRSAAQTVYDGRRVYFDDIGCLVLWQDKRSLSGKVWVYLDGAWTDALTVRFRGEQQTPMDFGFVPASNGGADWGDVQRAVRAKVRAP
jgi:hypothetical protein